MPSLIIVNQAQAVNRAEQPQTGRIMDEPQLKSTSYIYIYIYM